jgi:hypothetical protein
LFEYKYKLEGGNLVVMGGHLPNLADPLSSNRTPCGQPCPSAPAASDGLFKIEGDSRPC